MNKLISILVFMVLSGCMQHQINRTSSDASTYSAIAITHPDFDPKPGQSFAWHSATILPNALAQDDNKGFGQLIMASAEQELIQRGYRISLDKNTANYIIGVAVVGTDNDNSSAEINNFFRLFPNISSSSQGFSKASVLMGVIPTDKYVKPQDGQLVRDSVLWKGRLEAYVLGNNLDQSKRELRVMAFTKKLMASLP